VIVSGVGSIVLLSAGPLTEMVSVDEPVPVTVAGLKLPVMVWALSEVSLAAVKVTGESKPSAATTLTVVVALGAAGALLPIAPTLTGLGEAISSNEGVGAGGTGS
jgi:hypothetical protein